MEDPVDYCTSRVVEIIFAAVVSAYLFSFLPAMPKNRAPHGVGTRNCVEVSAIEPGYVIQTCEDDPPPTLSYAD